MQKLKTYLLRTQRPKVLPLEPCVSQNITSHASLTARDIFLESTLPVHLSAFFSKISPEFFLCQVLPTLVPVWAYRVIWVTLRVVPDE